MLRRTWLVVAAATAVAAVGCKPAAHSTAAIYPKIVLGMPLKDAKAAMGDDGEEGTYGSLPSFPKPRDIYSKLPQTTQWRVWSAVGKPSLVLGIVDDKVVYKEVQWTEDGERKADTSALPAYK